MDRKYNIIDDNGCHCKIANVKPLITEENLIKISNKGIYKRGIKDAEDIAEAEISCKDDFLFISFNDIKVSLKTDFKGVLCSCKSKTVCRHVITALKILEDCDVKSDCIPEKTVDSEIAEKPVEKIVSEDNEPEEKIEINKPYISDVISFIEAVAKKGIINCNSSDIDIAVQLSLKAENTIHNNISLMLRSFSVDIKNMSEKNVSFVLTNTFHTVSKIYNTARALISCENSQEKLKILCTDTGTRYVKTDSFRFAGLGAYPWSTKSGYAGITALIYCFDDGKIYTYSSSRADIHEKTQNSGSIENLSREFKAHSHWENLASLFQISCSSFKLFNCKTNSMNRISSSKQTVMNVEGFTSLSQLMNENLSINHLLTSDDEYDYFSERKSEKVCAIFPKSMHSIFYSKSEQVLKFELADDENIYPCEIIWSKQNQNGVSYIESIAKYGLKGCEAFVCRYYNGIFIPVSVFNGERIESFYFE